MRDSTKSSPSSTSKFGVRTELQGNEYGVRFPEIDIGSFPSAFLFRVGSYSACQSRGSVEQAARPLQT